MLKSINLKNYRCFSDHTLPLKPETIIVGRNNAGKSTIIEGFRLISIVLERSKNLIFKAVPDWLDIPLAHRGVQPDLSGLNVSWENLFHRYQDPPASLTASFSGGYNVTVHLGPSETVHAVIQDRTGRPIKTKGEARKANLPKLGVLPQVTPLAKEEKILLLAYVRSNMSTYLAPLHFRNQLNLLFSQYYNEFEQLVENSWPSLKIIELQGQGGLPSRSTLGLLVRDGDFVAEVAWMGHGLQMWLQAMWFLTRTSGYDTVILDEPDVYMHPDLQRRLLRFLRGRFSQLIIATHSTELLAEAETNNVLILDRNHKSSSFTTALPAVQRVIEDIGSAQNLHLTRLWGSKKLILIEGKDIKFMKYFQDLIFPNSAEPIDGLPNMPIGGWSGWPYAIGSAMLLKNAVGDDIITYCILDSDYYPPELRKKRLAEAKKKNVQLHIWRKKEIENYLLIPDAIYRVIHKRNRNKKKLSKVNDIRKKIDEIALKLKDVTIDSFAQEIYNLDRSKGISSANKRARKIVEDSWSSFHDRISIVSGKDVFSKLSGWSQRNFGISFSASAVLLEINRNEIDAEITNVINTLEYGSEF
jgi:hypothetical protein